MRPETLAIILLLVCGCATESQISEPATPTPEQPMEKSIETPSERLIFQYPENYPQIIKKKEVVPSDESLRNWENFTSLYGGRWEIEWDEYRDAPQYIRGNYPIGHFGVSELMINISREFLENHTDLFKINTSSLVFTRVTGDYSSATVFFQQYYKGIPVYFSKGTVWFNKEKRSIEALSLRYIPDINISTNPTISKEEAIGIASSNYDSPMPQYEPKNIHELTILGVYPIIENESIQCHLTWKIPFHWKTYYIDAYDGSILSIGQNVMAS